MPASQPAVPFAEPPWLNGLPSPYFNESHRRFQRVAREFIDENLHKYAVEWETAEEVPSHVFGQFAKANFLLPALPAPLPAKWLRKLGITHMPGEVPVEEWDALHTMIYADEVRCSPAVGSIARETDGWLTLSCCDADEPSRTRWP